MPAQAPDWDRHSSEYCLSLLWKILVNYIALYLEVLARVGLVGVRIHGMIAGIQLQCKLKLCRNNFGCAVDVCSPAPVKVVQILSWEPRQLPPQLKSLQGADSGVHDYDCSSPLVGVSLTASNVWPCTVLLLDLVIIPLEERCVAYSAAFAEFILRKVTDVNIVSSFLLIKPAGLYCVPTDSAQAGLFS